MPRIQFSIRCVDDVEERDLEDEWDRPDTWRSTTYHGFRVVSDNAYFDDAVDFNPKAGSYYTLVYVKYDTGDSFGRDYGRHEVVGVFDRDEDADRVVKAIQEDIQRHQARYYEGKEPEYSLDVTLSNGKTLTIHTGTWKGHFENFNDVIAGGIECLGS